VLSLDVSLPATSAEAISKKYFRLESPNNCIAYEEHLFEKERKKKKRKKYRAIFGADISEVIFNLHKYYLCSQN